jgi:hypothetical protein
MRAEIATTEYSGLETATSDIGSSKTPIRFPGAHPERPELIDNALRAFRAGENERGWSQLLEARSWTTSPEQALIEEAAQILRVAEYLLDMRAFARFREIIGALSARMDDLEHLFVEAPADIQSQVYETIGDFHDRITNDKAKALLFYDRALELTAGEPAQIQLKISRLQERNPYLRPNLESGFCVESGKN